MSKIVQAQMWMKNEHSLLWGMRTSPARLNALSEGLYIDSSRVLSLVLDFGSYFTYFQLNSPREKKFITW